eukprot:5311601-Lingulodinium_polyedra.AAC.1
MASIVGSASVLIAKHILGVVLCISDQQGGRLAGHAELHDSGPPLLGASARNTSVDSSGAAATAAVADAHVYLMRGPGVGGQGHVPCSGRRSTSSTRKQGHV